MIVAWMLHALSVAVLVGSGAAALDRALRLAKWPARWAWCFAIAASLMLPSLAWLTTRVPPVAQ